MAVQLRNRHTPLGVGGSRKDAKENRDQPQGQPHLVPVREHGSGGEAAGGAGDPLHPEDGGRGRHLRRPAIFPRPRRVHDRDLQLRGPPRRPPRRRRPCLDLQARSQRRDQLRAASAALQHLAAVPLPGHPTRVVECLLRQNQTSIQLVHQLPSSPFRVIYQLFFFPAPPTTSCLHPLSARVKVAAITRHNKKKLAPYVYARTNVSNNNVASVRSFYRSGYSFKSRRVPNVFTNYPARLFVSSTNFSSFRLHLLYAVFIL